METEQRVPAHVIDIIVENVISEQTVNMNINVPTASNLGIQYLLVGSLKLTWTVEAMDLRRILIEMRNPGTRGRQAQNNP